MPPASLYCPRSLPFTTAWFLVMMVRFPAWLLTLLECHIWRGLNLCIHALPIRQLSTWIELYQCLENLGVYPLCGLVGANILVSQFIADAHDTPCEFLSAISVRRDIGWLSDSHLCYFCFVHIHTNSKHRIVPDGQIGRA